MNIKANQAKPDTLVDLACNAEMVLSVSYSVSLQMIQPKTPPERRECGRDNLNVGTVEVYQIPIVAADKSSPNSQLARLFCKQTTKASALKKPRPQATA